MAISFAQVQSYLNAIATKANLDAGNARHGVFWHSSYHDFINGTVPNKQCNGEPVPIIDPDNKLDSAFYRILQAGWCGMPEMPKTGPFVTDIGYSVELSDGSEVSGDKLLEDIREWLAAGAPENG
jgi:hypothetical protein